MRVGIDHTMLAQRIDIGCLDLRIFIETGQIAITQVINEHQNNIRFFRHVSSLFSEYLLITIIESSINI